MILQFRGQNVSVCYEEHESIGWEKVYVGDVMKQFKDIPTEKQDISYFQSRGEALQVKISDQTHCPADIRYCLGDVDLNKLEYVCVAWVHDRGKVDETYVILPGSAYILNSNGKTIDHIA